MKYREQYNKYLRKYQYTKEFIEGEEAAMYGKSIRDNPYSEREEYEKWMAWRTGWWSPAL